MLGCNTDAGRSTATTTVAATRFGNDPILLALAKGSRTVVVRLSAMAGGISSGLAWLFFVRVEAGSHRARSYLVAGCATKLLNVAACSEVTGVGRTTSSKLLARRGGVAASSPAGSFQWFSNDLGLQQHWGMAWTSRGPFGLHVGGLVLFHGGRSSPEICRKVGLPNLQNRKSMRSPRGLRLQRQIWTPGITPVRL